MLNRGLGGDAEALFFSDHRRSLLMSKFVARFLSDDSGATAIEYSLIITMIAVVIVVAVGLLGERVGVSFHDANAIFTAG